MFPSISPGCRLCRGWFFCASFRLLGSKKKKKKKRNPTSRRHQQNPAGLFLLFNHLVSSRKSQRKTQLHFHARSRCVEGSSCSRLAVFGLVHYLVVACLRVPLPFLGLFLAFCMCECVIFGCFKSARTVCFII